MPRTCHGTCRAFGSAGIVVPSLVLLFAFVALVLFSKRRRACTQAHRQARRRASSFAAGTSCKCRNRITGSPNQTDSDRRFGSQSLLITQHTESDHPLTSERILRWPASLLPISLLRFGVLHSGFGVWDSPTSILYLTFPSSISLWGFLALEPPLSLRHPGIRGFPPRHLPQRVGVLLPRTLSNSFR